MRKSSLVIFISICILGGFLTSGSAQPILKKIIGAEGRPGQMINLKLIGENLLQVVRVEAIRFDDEELNALDYQIESDEVINIRIRIPFGAQPGRHKILVLVADQKTEMWLEPGADSRDATVVQYKPPEVDILYDDNLIGKEDGLSIDFIENTEGILVSKTITFRNPGKAPLALSSFNLPPELLLIGTLPDTILPEENITFELQLSPEAPDSFTQPLRFSINENPVTLQIDGIAIPTIPPEPEVPDSLEHLVIVVDSSDVWTLDGKSILLKNGGADTLKVSQLELPYGFKAIDLLPVQIPAFDSVAFRIQLDPEVLTNYEGILQFSFTRSEDNPLDYRIAAKPDRLLVPNIELSDVEGQIIREHTIDFGKTTVGKPIRKTFAIRNTGVTRLLLSNLNLPDGFMLVDSFPRKVDAGEVATYAIQLNADSARRATGNIEFQTNIIGQGLASFAVVGIVNDIAHAPEPPSGLPTSALVILSLLIGSGGSYLLIKKPVKKYRLKKSLSGNTTFQFKPKMDEGLQTIKQNTPIKPDFEVRLKPILDYGQQTIRFKNALILDEAIHREKSKSQRPDDLTRIEGIGPVISGILKKSGIETFRQLADADVQKIQQMLHAAGITGIADPTTWPMQAELAAFKEWKQLDKLQKKLQGGRIAPGRVPYPKSAINPK